MTNRWWIIGGLPWSVVPEISREIPVLKKRYHGCYFEHQEVIIILPCDGKIPTSASLLVMSPACSGVWQSPVLELMFAV